MLCFAPVLLLCLQDSYLHPPPLKHTHLLFVKLYIQMVMCNVGSGNPTLKREGGPEIHVHVHTFSIMSYMYM